MSSVPAPTPRSRPRITLARKRPLLSPSVTGLAYVCVMLALGMAAIHSQANLLFGIFGLMIGVLLVSGIIGRQVLRKLVVTRIVPEHAVVGQPMTITYEVANQKRFWPSLAVKIAEVDGAEAFVRQPLAYMLHTAPRSKSLVTAEMVAKRRGVHHFDRLQIITSFPFGFLERSASRRGQDSLLIYPAIGQVDPEVLKRCRSAESSGAMMRPRRGGTDEFYGIKEYQAGENPRWIYWRKSARTGTLLTKEMTHVSPPRLLLLVDTYRRDRSPELRTDVERAIAMAGSLASDALEQGLPVGIIARSADGWITLAPNRGKRHRRDILTELARLPINTQFDQHALLNESYRHRKSGTSAVLLTPYEMRLSLGESARGGLVVLASGSPNVQKWFKFEKAVNFASCAPDDL